MFPPARPCRAFICIILLFSLFFFHFLSLVCVPGISSISFVPYLPFLTCPLDANTVSMILLSADDDDTTCCHKHTFAYKSNASNLAKHLLRYQKVLEAVSVSIIDASINKILKIPSSSQILILYCGLHIVCEYTAESVLCMHEWTYLLYVVRFCVYVRQCVHILVSGSTQTQGCVFRVPVRSLESP